MEVYSPRAVDRLTAPDVYLTVPPVYALIDPDVPRKLKKLWTT